MSMSDSPTHFSKIDLRELALALLVAGGMAWLVVFFLVHRYLPPPFFYDTNDTFMDWYNTAYWVYSRSTYDVWGSIYPPISFVFLRILSIPACYVGGSFKGRDCDHIGVVVLCASLIINLVIAYIIYRKIDPRTAAPRALALGLGLPMLIAFERGNLILPCFTFFMLAHSRLLKSAWVRWLCLGVAVNFKPYLILTVIGSLLRRRWRRAEACAVSIVLIYLITFALFGHGSLLQILQNTFGFVYTPPAANIQGANYSPTYIDILKILKGPFPIMNFIGSRPVEIMESVAPAAMKLGEFGMLACFAGALWRPYAVRGSRLAALSLALLLTVSQPGGYALVFLFFLLFMEPMKGIGLTIVLISAYLLCVPWDTEVVHVLRELKYSYLGGQLVTYDAGVIVGAVVRPAILLVLEYALIAVTLSDVLRGGSADPVTIPGRGPSSPRGDAYGEDRSGLAGAAK
jgi:hypothetical protein